MHQSGTSSNGIPGRVMDYEWMRLLATILVVVGHSSYWIITTTHGGVYYGQDEHLWIDPVYFSAVFRMVRWLSARVYWFHMPAFFFLSGAVLALRPIGALRPFLVKKARHLLKPYLVCGLIWMYPVKLLTGFYTIENLPHALVAFALGKDDSGHLWFLPVLFVCMALFALTDRVLSALPYGHIRFLRTAVLLVGATLLYLFRRQFPALFGLNLAAQYFVWFVLGYAFEPVRAAIAALPSRCSTALYTTGFAGVSGVWLLTHRLGLDDRRLDMLLGCAWLYLLAALCAKFLRRAESTRIFRTTVAALFWVYLIHDPLEHLLLHLFMQNRGWLTPPDAGCICWVAPWAHLCSVWHCIRCGTAGAALHAGPNQPPKAAE